MDITAMADFWLLLYLTLCGIIIILALAYFTVGEMMREHRNRKELEAFGEEIGRILRNGR